MTIDPEVLQMCRCLNMAELREWFEKLNKVNPAAWRELEHIIKTNPPKKYVRSDKAS